MLRPALSIHQDHSGTGNPSPSIPPLASEPPSSSYSSYCIRDGHITTPHLPSAGWALAVNPGLRETNTSPTPAPGLGLPHGTRISALPLASPTTATTRALHTRTSHVGGQVTPSPVSPHQTLSLPPLPFLHITLALHVILLLS